ncbi:uncharacterized protein C8R40DRAFT_1178009 [Lentinula edodes]|uniref:uncharacterized protein n=1 Tax=Lentinula edodes TaxID=5353 RepID=UPI001E8E9533|nr:uncharacterized protein C8R40DRAFT_1178009 [Lentinula edodes]KAH7868270.1 hypothetical protein C8R40DRAFT_1178009 [Lentinula edodes]
MADFAFRLSKKFLILTAYNLVLGNFCSLTDTHASFLKQFLQLWCPLHTDYLHLVYLHCLWQQFNFPPFFQPVLLKGLLPPFLPTSSPQRATPIGSTSTIVHWQATRTISSSSSSSSFSLPLPSAITIITTITASFLPLFSSSSSSSTPTTGTFSVPAPSISSLNSNSHIGEKGSVIGSGVIGGVIGGGAAVIITVIALVIYYRSKRRCRRQFPRVFNCDENSELDDPSGEGGRGGIGGYFVAAGAWCCAQFRSNAVTPYLLKYQITSPTALTTNFHSTLAPPEMTVLNRGFASASHSDHGGMSSVGSMTSPVGAFHVRCTTDGARSAAIETPLPPQQEPTEGEWGPQVLDEIPPPYESLVPPQTQDRPGIRIMSTWSMVEQFDASDAQWDPE